jgi:hypothetical protein
MSKRILPFLVTYVVASGLWAANDPFVGKWKLNPSKSVLTDHLKVEAAGENRYTITFGSPDTAETIVADGTDQPGMYGSKLAITIQGPGDWKVVRKGPQGRVLLTGIWKLSEDGNTFSDKMTAAQADGSMFNMNLVYKRTRDGSGFVGDWESTSEQVNSVYEMQIEPYQEDGLSVISAAEGVTKSLKFDGKDYPNTGANVVAGSVTSGRRTNDHSLELTDKIKDKVTDTTEATVSADGSTLTMTVHEPGQSKPNILVFDRQ